MNVKGIDLSNHNSGIKMETLKDRGYEFVILRGGYTGWGSRSKNKDKSFETFYTQAKNLGIPVGCYYYSCANDSKTGIEEAEYLYNNCLKGKQFEYPIYIDVEDEHWQMDNKQGVTDAVIGFCSTLEKLGYWVGIYSGPDWFDTYMDGSKLSKYTKWLARWSSKKPAFNYNAFDMWQNTNKLIFKGTNDPVDGDICYRDFPTLIKQRHLNGFTDPAMENVAEVGDTVKIKSGAKYQNGKRVPVWVRLLKWIVSKANKKDSYVVIGECATNNKLNINSSISREYLEIVKKH